MRQKRGHRKEVQSDLDGVFRLFPRLRERQKQSAGTLSDKEQQMLAIARVLMSKPQTTLIERLKNFHDFAPGG